MKTVEYFETNISFWQSIKMKIFLLTLVGICFVFAKTYASELSIAKNHCKGTVEVMLWDRTRCDCVTETHAIEYEWANKWSQSLGQALHYGRLLNKKPGIVLILKKETDRRYYNMLKKDIEFHGLKVDVWVIGPDA